MTYARSQRGFTLIEMLAATVLLAISLGVLLPVFGLSMRWLKQDEVRSRMAVVARSLIDEATLAGLQAGQTEGLRDGLQWRLECQRQGAAQGAALFTLRLTLRGGEQVEQFSTARLQPVRPGLVP